MRPIPGALRLGARRALRLASRGFGNRKIAVTPCRFAVRAPSQLSLRLSRPLHARGSPLREGRAPSRPRG